MEKLLISKKNNINITLSLQDGAIQKHFSILIIYKDDNIVFIHDDLYYNSVMELKKLINDSLFTEEYSELIYNNDILQCLSKLIHQLNIDLMEG